jgi:hypothetical protein
MSPAKKERTFTHEIDVRASFAERGGCINVAG